MTAEGHVEDASLLARLAGDLPATEAARIDAHLASCPGCRGSLEAFQRVRGGLLAGSQEPSPFASARMKRGLAEALRSGPVTAPRLVRRSRAAAAVAFAAISGAAVAMTATRSTTDVPANLSESASTGASGAAMAPAVPVGPVRAAAAVARELLSPPAVVLERPVLSDVEASKRDGRQREERLQQRPRRGPLDEDGRASADGAGQAASGVRVALAHRDQRARERDRGEALEAAWQKATSGSGTPDWVALGDAFAQAGAIDRAADAWVEGLASPASATAAQRLSSAAREDVLDPDALLQRLASAALDNAEALRLQCEWSLRHRGDRAAVESCRTFGRAYPAHPAVRTLALAAGQVAETRLDDLPLAVAEYSRAIMVSEYAGVPSSEALLSRARARTRLGDRAEAQADLRLYLHVAPEAYNRGDIRALADTLGVPAP